MSRKREPPSDLESRLAEVEVAGEVGTWHWDIDGGQLAWSSEFCRIFGIPADTDPTVERFMALVHPDDRDRLTAVIEHAQHGQAWTVVEYRIVRADGALRWIESRKRAVVDATGHSVGMTGTARDITHAKALEEDQALLEAVAETTSDAVVVCDPEGAVITMVNRAAQNLFGREPLSPAEHAERARFHRPDGTPITAEELPVLRALREGAVEGIELGIEGPGGGDRTVIATGRALPATSRVTRGAVTSLRDVTDERTAIARFLDHAFHDPLTGLANRALLQEHLRRALDRAVRNDWITAVLAIDIDDFRRVNDALGHDVGDELLVQMGRRLETALRSYDTVARPYTVARLGGDEFFVLCEDVRGERGAATIAARVADVISSPFELAGRVVAVTASVGVVFRGGGGEPEALVLDAEVAMRRAKEQGGERPEYFAEGMRTAVQALADREAALARALEKGEFRLAYQPKVSLATGRIEAVEALLRWEDPERGTIAPLQFIGLAEESGMIVPIGAWVLGEGCSQAVDWARPYPERPPLRMCLNVSGRQFDADIVGAVQKAIGASGIEPGLVCLEVTESVVMSDIEAAIETLDDLKSLGVQVSIDDFGTGYSSLAYLQRMPLDEIKVDRSFVDGLGRDAEDTAIVAAVVAMAHALDLVVVAEGVETAEQLEALKTLGCEMAQGYYFARPMPPDALDALLVAEAAGTWIGHEAETEGPEPTPGLYRKERVLVVDDTPDVRQLARISLTAAGFEVHDAADGPTALAMAAELRPDCVVLDVVMPGMDGIEVCRALHADPRTAHCTVVMLTGEAASEDKVEAFSFGADDYIVKPFSPRDLVSRVRSAMRRS